MRAGRGWGDALRERGFESSRKEWVGTRCVHKDEWHSRSSSKAMNDRESAFSRLGRVLSCPQHIVNSTHGVYSVPIKSRGTTRTLGRFHVLDVHHDGIRRSLVLVQRLRRMVV